LPAANREKFAQAAAAAPSNFSALQMGTYVKASRCAPDWQAANLSRNAADGFLLTIDWQNLEVFIVSNNKAC